MYDSILDPQLISHGGWGSAGYLYIRTLLRLGLITERNATAKSGFLPYGEQPDFGCFQALRQLMRMIHLTCVHCRYVRRFT